MTTNPVESERQMTEDCRRHREWHERFLYELGKTAGRLDALHDSVERERKEHNRRRRLKRLEFLRQHKKRRTLWSRFCARV